MKALAHMKKIERKCYPAFMCQLDGVESWQDLAEYAEGTPTVKVWKNGYIIVTDGEVIDLAVNGKWAVRDIFGVLGFLRRHFGERAIEADLRASTSYPLVKSLEMAGRIEIISTEEWEWDGETMYACRLRMVSTRH